MDVGALSHVADQIGQNLLPSQAGVTAAYIAFIGTLLTLAAKAVGQIVTDRQARRHAVLTARTSLYAEIRRTKLTTQGHIDFVDYDEDACNGMIWIVVYPSLFPSPESLARIEKLSAREVRRITSFYFSYKETVGFLKASAMEILPFIDEAGPTKGKRRSPVFDLDMDMIEYVYGDGAVDAARRADLLRRLKVIDEQSKKALAEIEAAVRQRRFAWPSELADMIEEGSAQDDNKRKVRQEQLATEQAERAAARSAGPAAQTA